LTPMGPYTLLDYRVISHTLDFGAIPYRKYWKRNRLAYGEEFLQRTGTEKLGFNTVRLYTELYCPYNCSFCTGPGFMTEGVTGHQRALLLPPADIMRLIHRIRRAYPETNYIYFGSDNFILNKERIYTLCDLIESQLGDAELGFSAITRLDIVDAILLHRLKQVGFQQLSYGIESTSERLHQDISKRLHPVPDSTYAANALRGA
ncbi:MAG: radical SAM protein, partial [Proteobacteria bacterium]|nr:radical SAM protein [Pseudomonadota bacterium]